LFKDSKYSVMILVTMIGVTVLSVGYLSWYMSPTEVVETVEIIANTDSGCIAETMDGFPVNIGPCNAKAGDLIAAKVDSKVKERAAAMNP